MFLSNELSQNTYLIYLCHTYFSVWTFYLFNYLAILIVHIYYNSEFEIKIRDMIMLTTKISALSFSLIAALAMTGCSNTGVLEQKINNLNTKVDNLSTKVDSLSTEVTGLNAQQEQSDEMVAEVNLASEQAAIEAKRANDRITNMVKSYKK